MCKRWHVSLIASLCCQVAQGPSLSMVNRVTNDEMCVASLQAHLEQAMLPPRVSSALSHATSRAQGDDRAELRRRAPLVWGCHADRKTKTQILDTHLEPSPRRHPWLWQTVSHSGMRVVSQAMD